MAYDAQGKWIPEDDSVSTRLNGLLATDNPLMARARTSGVQFGNKRGLLNSSITGQAAEQAAINTALPIASQEASQVAQKNVAAQGQRSAEDIARMNVAAHDRQYSAAALAEAQKTYGAIFTEVLKNNDLSAASRNNYYSHASSLRDTSFNLIEQLYGINLDWTGAVATHA